MGNFSRRLKGQWLRGLCLVLVLLCAMSGTAFATEPQDVGELPHVAKWVNGMAVTEDGVYLEDTWAVDDTGVSERVYVLVGQGCMEEMRVERYPENITDGETMPCPKYDVAAALVLPEGVSGDVMVEIESSWAVYSVVFREAEGYNADMALYPGVYRITDVEIAGDVDGTYAVGNYQSFDAATEKVLTFEVEVAEEAVDEGDDAVGGEVNADDTDSDSSTDEEGNALKDNELFWDTVKTVLLVIVLLLIYVALKRKREKSEEKQY